jgi:CheY-like chemotaxis protein
VGDDDPAGGRLVKVGLESTGDYQVFTETVGAHSLATARECRPDLILLDILMPDTDGADVAAMLQEDCGLRHIKLVFLTALLKKGEDAVSGRHLVIAKPVTTKELAAIIDDELGRSRPA